jgi:hypothetical protein
MGKIGKIANALIAYNPVHKHLFLLSEQNAGDPLLEIVLTDRTEV